MSSAVVVKPNRPMKPEEWGFPGWLTAEQESALKAFTQQLLQEGVFTPKRLVAALVPQSTR